MEGFRLLAHLGTLSEGSLDVVSLLVVLAILVGVFRIARGLSAWRTERRMGGKRGAGELFRLRGSGSLSEEEFEADKARVRRK